ncbi:19682_t:CDS:2 [Gigaspora margarita]|uniref:Aminomethyltransferase n=1 Tax=Gigaspora margarita TaxID=4874 RepID=A0ABM8W6I9_GIGMA|nr:19682_t:CDS:2 [Gigaspora margarita]
MKQTPLYNYHIEKGGKMVPFAGWSMPVYYANQGVLSEHIHTREYASLFDVSHMLQFKILGKDRIRFLESLVVADIEEMPFGSSVLSVFTNENGGIIDDTVICKHADHLYVVSNAACADKDLAHVRTKMGEFQNKGGWVDLKVIDDRALLALQGPLAAEILRKLCDKDLSDFMFMTARFLHVKTIESHVSRSGYTGEDGFEVTKLILGYPSVHFAGLGARDSLRLEAGLCLYGHDLDDSITPVEAGLSWTIGKRRRVEGGFLGANRILSQLKGGVARRRVGLMIEGAPARENAEIYNSDDELIGKVTSGGPSPTLNKNIAMGYVKSGYHKSGTLLKVKVRNKLQDAKIVKMPFVPSKYHK